jgi:cytidylate kinase
MTARLVCISRTMAAHGEAIGNLVAQRLDFRYVDEQVIQRAAHLAQVDPKLVAAVEQRQPLLRRVLDKLTAARGLVGPAAIALGVPVSGAFDDPHAHRGSADDLRILIQAAIHEIADQGRAVILAHAASMALAERRDVVRVLITASDATRAERLAATNGLAAEAAAAEIAASDRNRRDYFQRFYDVAEELPTHYDLVINTDVPAPDHAADAIACIVRARAATTQTSS